MQENKEFLCCFDIMILSFDFERSQYLCQESKLYLEILPIAKKEEYRLDYDTKRGIRGIL